MNNSTAMSDKSALIQKDFKDDKALNLPQIEEDQDDEKESPIKQRRGVLRSSPFKKIRLGSDSGAVEETYGLKKPSKGGDTVLTLNLNAVNHVPASHSHHANSVRSEDDQNDYNFESFNKKGRNANTDMNTIASCTRNGARKTSLGSMNIVDTEHSEYGAVFPNTCKNKAYGDESSSRNFKGE